MAVQFPSQNVTQRPPIRIDADYAASAYDQVVVSTAAVTIKITLPPEPMDLDNVRVLPPDDSWGHPNALVLDPGTETINTVAGFLNVLTPVAFDVTFYSGYGWRLSTEFAAANTATAAANQAHADMLQADLDAAAAEAAKIAAEAAAAIAISGGPAGSSSSLTDLTDRYDTETLSRDGFVITRRDKWAPATQGPQNQSFNTAWVMTTGRGSRIELESTLSAVATATAYAGAAYDGVLWMRGPCTIDGSGNILCQCNPVRSSDEKDWINVTINPTAGIVLDSSWFNNYVIVTQSFGQSVDRGGTGDSRGPQVITTTAIDPGNALMLDVTNVANDFPCFAQGVPYGNFIDMRHAAPGATSGESHICAQTLTFLNRCLARGAKIATTSGSWAAGGHTTWELDADFPPHLQADYASLSALGNRVGSFYQQLLRGLIYTLNLIKLAGKKPIVLPLVFGGAASDAIQAFGTTAAELETIMLRLQKRYATDVARLCNWSPFAPGLPMMLIQDVFTGNNMQPDPNTRIFGRGIDGSSLAFWSLSLKYRDQFIFGGTRYACEEADDFTHLLHNGYFRDGETNAGHALANVFLWKHENFNPACVYRESDTKSHIIFNVPAQEGTLTLDTAWVSDDPAGKKNIVMWACAAGQTIGYPVNITSVVFDTTSGLKPFVTINHDAVTDESFFDIGVWKLPGFSGNRSRTQGPRTNFRGSVARASLLPNYIDPFTGLNFPASNNYRWCPICRIRRPKTNLNLLEVDGRLP